MEYYATVTKSKVDGREEEGPVERSPRYIDW